MTFHQPDNNSALLLPSPTLSTSSLSLPDEAANQLLPPNHQSLPCNHGRLTRDYTPLNSDRCLICGSTPPEGLYLLRSTADTRCRLPETISPQETPHQLIIIPQPSTTQLSPTSTSLPPTIRDFLAEGNYTIEELNTIPHLDPSVINAISRRHYTHDQVKTLLQQRQAVWTATRGDADANTPSITAAAHLVPHCTYTVCPVCRPPHADDLPSFDEVLSGPVWSNAGVPMATVGGESKAEGGARGNAADDDAGEGKGDADVNVQAEDVEKQQEDLGEEEATQPARHHRGYARVRGRGVRVRLAKPFRSGCESSEQKRERRQNERSLISHAWVDCVN